MRGDTPREAQVIALLLRGYSNKDMAAEMGISALTVKLYFNRLFLRYGISDGMKRVKLAALLYRREHTCQTSTEPVFPQTEKPTLSALWHRDSKTEKLQPSLEQASKLSKITSATFTTNSAFGIDLNWLCGTRPEG